MHSWRGGRFPAPLRGFLPLYLSIFHKQTYPFSPIPSAFQSLVTSPSAMSSLSWHGRDTHVSHSIHGSPPHARPSLSSDLAPIPSSGAAWGVCSGESDYFLVRQIGCGNLPVQFVGTKVAFVTHITLLISGSGGLGAGKGDRQVWGWVACYPLVGSLGTGTGGRTLTPNLSRWSRVERRLGPGWSPRG